MLEDADSARKREFVSVTGFVPCSPGMGTFETIQEKCARSLGEIQDYPRVQIDNQYIVQMKSTGPQVPCRCERLRVVSARRFERPKYRNETPLRRKRRRTGGSLQASRNQFSNVLSKVTVSLDGAFHNTEAVRLRNVRIKRLDSKATVVFKPLWFERSYDHDER